MPNKLLGEYTCTHCVTEFTIEDSNIVDAYDEWAPSCPTCGTRDKVEPCPN